MSDIILKEMIKQDPLQTCVIHFRQDSFHFWEQLTFAGHSKMPILCKTTSPSIQRCYSFDPLFLFKALVKCSHDGGAFKLVLNKLNITCNVLHAVMVFELPNVEYRREK